ncbi:MAG: hypothetical protein GY913_26190 [Proteobacteria bacterium]|nr:hypothetical protein [Pseudomonadota bacterium]
MLLTPSLTWALLACSTAPTSSAWLDQVEPGGPCYEANLLDGLSEESTDELHAIYDCLNRQHAFEALGGTVDSLDAPTRASTSAGVDLAVAVNQAGEQDVDVFGLAGLALDLFDSGELPFWADLSAELLYGRSILTLQSGAVDLRAGSALDRGVLRPAFPALKASATASLDNDMEPLAVLADALESPRVDSIVHSLAGLVDQHPGVQDLPAHLGDAIARSRDASNDRWTDASGDSLRDLSEALLVETGGDGRIALEHLADPARVLLADDQVKARLETVLTRLDNSNRLRQLPPQIVYLAEVDAGGGDLTTGEDSALVALLRLIERADGPMTCSLDLWVTSLSVTIDNLAIEILTVLADQDPETVDSGVGLMGEVLGWDVSQSVLYSIADSGVCDPLDAQMVDDLQALDRFNDSATGDLLYALLWTLQAVHEVDTSRLPELVDLLSTVRVFEADRPLEEVLRDIGTSQLMYDLIEGLPILIDGDMGDLPPSVEPLDFDMVWAIALDAFDNGAGGTSPVQELAPVLQAAIAQDGTWVAIGNLGELLETQDANTAVVLEHLPTLIALDPELDLITGLAPLVGDERLSRPLARVLETPEVTDALGAAELTDEGPLPFYGRLVVGGTLDAALSLLDWTLDMLRGDPEV